MKKINLKNTDLMVSNIALGTDSYGSIVDDKLSFEMLDFYYQRFAGDPLSEAERELFANEWLFEYFLPLKEILKRTFHYYFIEWGYGITLVVYSLVTILPITSLFSALWINAIKKSVNAKFVEMNLKAFELGRK